MGSLSYPPAPTTLNTDRAAAMAGGYIDKVMAHADDAYARALGLLNSLGALGNFPTVDTDTGWTELAPPVLRFDIGVPPTAPTIQDVAAPGISFDFIYTPYVSQLLDSLKARLLNEILNGGTGLSAAVEQAMYDRETERDRLELSDTIDRIATRWSEAGFSLPDGILTGMTTMADVAYQNKQADKSRKITEDSFKTAVENTRFMIDQSVKLEDVLMRFNNESNRVRMEAAKAILEAGIAIFDALIKQNLAKVELFKAEAQAYEAEAKALGAIAEVDVALYKAQSDYNTARSNVAIKEIEMQIKQLEVEMTLATEIAKSISDVASRLAAGAMSAVNAGASVQYGGHDQNSVSDNRSLSHAAAESESTSYSYNYNWDMTA